MDKSQLRDLIKRVLKEAELYSESAVELLMLTAAVESKLGYYIRQLNGGPAVGIFQMEPNTHDDIWKNYISYKDWYSEGMMEDAAVLEYDLEYSIVMARYHYLRVKEPLPEAWDVVALADYWKRHYNTRLGKGTPEKAVKAYYQYVA